MEDYAMFTKLGQETKDKWQLVHASQAYGTFYCIYAKFEPNLAVDKLVKYEFKLVNYKGLINLGIDGVMLSLDDADADLAFTIKVQGLIKDKDIGDTISVDLDWTKAIKGSFYIDLQPLHGNDYSKSDYLKNHVFDQEFFYRDSDIEKDDSDDNDNEENDYRQPFSYKHDGAKKYIDYKKDQEVDRNKILNFPCIRSEVVFFK